MNGIKQIKEFKQQPYKINPVILKEYDIRGQIDKNLYLVDAFAIGCAFGTYIKRKGGHLICVGYDGRTSSPSLAEALISGLTSTGINVNAIGLGPTPMLSFAIKDNPADAGIIVTGSHNPPDHNGFKMSTSSGPFYGDMIQELGQMSEEGDFEVGEGSAHNIDIKDKYVERLLRDIPPLKNMKIAWDCGNGASGEIIRRIIKKIPGDHILMFDEIDGSFPNHHPDPTVDENLKDLITTVKKENCDIGIAFDGDADRVGAVDEQGNILRSDTLMTVYAKDVLTRHPGATIIGDVKCSQVMFDEINRLGGKALMWKTGHSLIKAKMAEENSPLSGELSGHIFFGDGWYGFDDGIYCALRLLKEVSKAKGPASSLISHLPQIYNTKEVRFEVNEEHKFDLVRRITLSAKQQAKTNISLQVNDIDGARVTTPHGWWLVRASNTQNMLVTRVEANSLEYLEELKLMAQEEIRKVGYEVNYNT